MRKGTLKEYAKLARIEYSGFSCVTVIGALSVQGSNLELADAVLLFFLNVVALIWGFVHNDYCDLEIDKRSEELRERPLVKGTVSPKAALAIVISCLLINLAIPLFFIKDMILVIILLGSIILAASYNMFSKRIVGSDIFYAGSATLLVLFGALSVTDSTGVQQVAGLTVVILAVEFIDHFFFNAVEGGLKDIENDQQVGAKTIASCLVIKDGNTLKITKTFKTIAITLKLATILLIFTPFLFLRFAWSSWQLIFLIILSLVAIIFTIKILNVDTFDRKKIGNYSLLQELACKALVPLMLIGFIGAPWALAIILVPLIWFHLFNYILHGAVLTLPKSF